MKKELITVGIGASAGGLSAINEFFDHIGPNTGMAFIVVQHLSPDFKSLMDELLSKHTQMPISVIREATPVKPNHIYLISKENNIIIKDGIIQPVNRKARFTLNLPIDEFFHSLGKDQREHSVGIILSGTGSDGSRGIGSIKEAGGLVFVQDPVSAQFDGMPRAAMDTGFPDNVLTPTQIAKSLMNLVNSSKMGYLLFLNPDDKKVENKFFEILGVLRNQLGVDFTEYRKTTLYRRIEKRMFLTHKNSIEEYSELINKDQKEVENLYKDFLIGVTRFFRDEDAFKSLDNNVICKIVEETDRKEPIRVWVTACSTGEEAYTLAMLFLECIEKTGVYRKFKIFASDLDAHAIGVASKGTYAREIANNIPPRFLEKYFYSTPQGELSVTKIIREKVVFTVHDALNDPPFINLDLVSCRNFLIYLKPDIQQNLLVNFQFALKHKGYLFLGPSESLGGVKDAFAPVNERWNIFQNILEGKLKPSILNRRESQRRKKQKAEKKTRVIGLDHRPVPAFENVFANWVMRRYVPMLFFVNEELDVLHLQGDAHQLFNYPTGPNSFNLTRLLDEPELLIFKTGIRKTLENQSRNAYNNISFGKDEKVLKIDLTFEPATIRQLANPTILITANIRGEQNKLAESDREIITVDEKAYTEEKIKTLDLELRQVKGEKQSLIERLGTTNEELQSSNEELLATNEELQSTNEELQSVNEELYTVNSELQGKVAELTVSNSDMDNLLKATGIGTIFVDDELTIRRFTPAVQQQFKLLSSDLGRPITSFVNSFSEEKIYSDFKKVLKNNKKIEREVIDDKGHPYLMRLLPYRLENKKTDGVVATFVDIKDIKDAAKKAESLAEKYHLLYQNSKDHISFLDENLQLIEINRTADGFKKEEVIGQSLWDLIPKQVHHFYKAAFEDLKLSNNKKIIDFKAPIVFPNGEKHWYECVLSALQSQHGPDKYLIITTDTTKEKKIEKDTRQKAAIFAGLYKYVKAHILILDKKGIVKSINFTGAGYKKSEVLDTSIVELIPEGKARDQMQRAVEIMQEGADEHHFQYNFKGKDDKIHYYDNSLFPIYSAEDELEEVIYISRDITAEVTAKQLIENNAERLALQVKASSKKMEDINIELEEANSYLDSFVHGAAHDLRSPLTQMQGFLNLLPEIEEREDRLAAYQELNDASHRMERVLNGLVELISFKKNVSPILKEINLLKLYNAIIVDLSPYIHKAEGTIKVDIPKKLNIVYIEAFLNSVLYNLIHNAVKYRAYERPLDIRVTAKKEKEFVVIKITDNGIGMDLQRYGHFLFEPFKRLTMDRPGTGIGLSIINSSVRRNGGRIEVESRLDKGTTFKVYLKPYALKD